MNTLDQRIPSLVSRNVMVVGGSGDIGNEISIHLANLGAKVYIGYKTEHKLNRDALSHVANTEFIKIDLENPNDLIRIKYPELDALIFAAGIPSLDNIIDCTHEEMMRQFEVHVFGPLLVTQKIASSNSLRDIIFISSTAGIELSPGSGAYALSKSTTISLVKLLSKQLRPKGVRVNCIAPGWCETSMAEYVLNMRGSSIDQLKETRIDNSIVSPMEIARLCGDLLTNRYQHLQGQIIVLESMAK